MISSVDPVSGWVQQVVDRKDERAGKKRMQEWFPEPPAHEERLLRPSL
jgi:hypothetical protein